MQVHRSFDDLPNIANPVVTTGTFDGVHLGHTVILNRLNRLAQEVNGESVLITFHPHPRIVLYPESAGNGLKLICSQREKIYQLEKTGIDHVIIIPFTVDFSKITSKAFVEELLLGKLHARKIIVGFNHHFGHNREGDYSFLDELTHEHPFEVEEIPEQELEHETVSSTIIRKALHAGRIQRANAYLDHFYVIMGPLSTGDPKCAQAGFPTLSVEIEEGVKLIPPDGVYAIQLMVGNASYRGMLNIKRPQEKPLPSLQVHLFDYTPQYDVRGHVGTLTFHKGMREEFVLADRDDLRRQLDQDRKEIEELIY